MRSERARSRLPSPAGPMAMARSVTDGVGSRAASMSPPTLTLIPTRRLASASKKARWSFQRMTCGPSSAASSARIKAIAILNSVVCTMAPVQVLCAAFRLEPNRPYQH